MWFKMTVINFVYSVLDDEHGINDKALQALQKLYKYIPLLRELFEERIKCQDNRYFIQEKEEKEETE